MANPNPSKADIAAFRRWQNDWVLFAEEVIGVFLDDEQKDALRSVQHNRRTVIRSGHARGKDFIAAVASLCFLYLNVPSKVISTAPTGRQVRGIMLAEAKKLWQKADERLAKQGKQMGGRFLNDGIVFDEDPSWFMLGFKAQDKDVEAWTGFHAPHVLVVVTEASGIEQATFDAIEGLLTGNSRLLLVLNPNRTTGEAYNAFRSKQYAKFTFNCMNAPNVLAKKIVIPGQVDWEWVNEHVEKPGWTVPLSEAEAHPDEGDFEWEGAWYRPSDLFRVKVLGMWPRESEDQLIPLSWVEAANERWREWNEAGGHIPEAVSLRLGGDIAGMGADLTVLLHRYEALVPKIDVLAKSDHMATAGRVKAILENKPDAKGFIDTIGEGAGVHSRLVEQGVQSISVKFSEHAKGLRDLTEEREFANMRAYCWWAIRDALDPKLGAELALPPVDELIQDLTSPLWSVNSQGKILIEPKDKIKERLGRSPDFGDALANTYYPRDAVGKQETGVFEGIGVF